jgi:hypothetical protein
MVDPGAEATAEADKLAKVIDEARLTAFALSVSAAWWCSYIHPDH